MKHNYWWVVVITSVDYYTMYDGAYIVRGYDIDEAIENAKSLFIAKSSIGGDAGFGSYRSIETCFRSSQKIEEM